ncbi:hypothetical protein ES705_46781 [subsurface metagenome]
MTRKILWMLLSFLLVVSLVLASCAKEEVVEEEEEEEEEEVVEEEEEEEEEEPAVGEPQYGGTLTAISYLVKDSGTAGTYDYAWPGILFHGPVLEYALRGDLEKYGPRGTGELPFAQDAWVSIDKYFGDNSLVESFEVAPDKIVFHIRRGIYWQPLGREYVMERREYTAYDFVLTYPKDRLFFDYRGCQEHFPQSLSC